jgi:hypothetical protein
MGPDSYGAAGSECCWFSLYGAGGHGWALQRDQMRPCRAGSLGLAAIVPGCAVLGCASGMLAPRPCAAAYGRLLFTAITGLPAAVSALVWLAWPGGQVAGVLGCSVMRPCMYYHICGLAAVALQHVCWSSYYILGCGCSISLAFCVRGRNVQYAWSIG